MKRTPDKMMIVTTNYDTLLEQAFLEAQKPYELVVYPADNEEYANGVLWWPH
jgi:SIR2-like domain